MKAAEASDVNGSRSGRGVTILLITFAVATLYVLSTGPVIKLAFKGKIPFTFVDTFYKPLDMLSRRVPGADSFFEWYLHRLWKVEPLLK